MNDLTHEIEFVEHYEVKDDSGDVYEPGDTLKCNEATRNHFVRRRVAVDYEPKSTTKKASKKTSKK